MSLLSYNKLVELVESGVIDADPANINGASIDITLDREILYELESTGAIDLAAKETLRMRREDITYDNGYILQCGEFILASSRETFNLPNNIACEYKLKSSLARCGLQHMLAGYCDPGWNGSKLTLELKNVTENHELLLTEGMKIGQMIFFECEPVPAEHDYAAKGQYNGQTTVTGSKGLK